MATKKGSRGGHNSTPGKIAALVGWNNRPFLDKMIDEETPAKELVAWCKDNGFYISLPTMYTYMKQRREGVVNNLTNELLQPKTEDSLRKALEEASKKGGEQNKVNRREDRARAKQIMANATEQMREQESPKRIRHDLELLDEVIQKDFDTLSKMEVISPSIAIKAMEMKHKLTNGSTGGYTHYGLEEIKLREDAREQAITAVILQFIPVEQHDAVIQRMEDVTRAYYESIGLGEAYAQQVAREAMEDHA